MVVLVFVLVLFVLAGIRNMNEQWTKQKKVILLFIPKPNLQEIWKKIISKKNIDLVSKDIQFFFITAHLLFGKIQLHCPIDDNPVWCN